MSMDAVQIRNGNPTDSSLIDLAVEHCIWSRFMQDMISSVLSVCCWWTLKPSTASSPWSVRRFDHMFSLDGDAWKVVSGQKSLGLVSAQRVIHPLGLVNLWKVVWDFCFHFDALVDAFFMHEIILPLVIVWSTTKKTIASVPAKHTSLAYWENKTALNQLIRQTDHLNSVHRQHRCNHWRSAESECQLFTIESSSCSCSCCSH